VYATIDCPGPRLAVCHLSGSLDGECVEHLRATMAACVAFPELHLDLSGVVFIDSGGVGVVVGGVRRIREQGGSVVAWGPRSNIRRLLAAVGFDRVVPICDGSPASLGPSVPIAS